MGLGLIWKPRGQLSQKTLLEFKNQVLQLEKVSGKSQIGHTGTLDPFAEGLLLVGWLEGTKLLFPLNGLDKTYRVGMRFGSTTDSLDLTGVMTEAAPEKLAEITDLAVSRWLPPKFFEDFLKAKIGPMDQVPPIFSAVHVDGQRAYDLARKGETPVLKAKKVELLAARHIAFDPKLLEWVFEVTVSTGTYIRSFARDWGLELCGFPGHLSSLLRLRVGAFEWGSELPETTAGEGPIQYKLLKIQDLSHYFETERLTQMEATRLSSFGRMSREFSCRLKPILLLGPDEKPVAWLEKDTGAIGRIFRSDPFA